VLFDAWRKNMDAELLQGSISFSEVISHISYLLEHSVFSPSELEQILEYLFGVFTTSKVSGSTPLEEAITKISQDHHPKLSKALQVIIDFMRKNQSVCNTVLSKLEQGSTLEMLCRFIFDEHDKPETCHIILVRKIDATSPFLLQAPMKKAYVLTDEELYYVENNNEVQSIKKLAIYHPFAGSRLAYALYSDLHQLNQDPSFDIPEHTAPAVIKVLSRSELELIENKTSIVTTPADYRLLIPKFREILNRLKREGLPLSLFVEIIKNAMALRFREDDLKNENQTALIEIFNTFKNHLKETRESFVSLNDFLFLPCNENYWKSCFYIVNFLLNQKVIDDSILEEGFFSGFYLKSLHAENKDIDPLKTITEQMKISVIKRFPELKEKSDFYELVNGFLSNPILKAYADKYDSIIKKWQNLHKKEKIKEADIALFCDHIAAAKCTVDFFDFMPVWGLEKNSTLVWKVLNILLTNNNSYSPYVLKKLTNVQEKARNNPNCLPHLYFLSDAIAFISTNTSKVDSQIVEKLLKSFGDAILPLLKTYHLDTKLDHARLLTETLSVDNRQATVIIEDERKNISYEDLWDELKAQCRPGNKESTNSLYSKMRLRLPIKPTDNTHFNVLLSSYAHSSAHEWVTSAALQDFPGALKFIGEELNKGNKIFWPLVKAQQDLLDKLVLKVDIPHCVSDGNIFSKDFPDSSRLIFLTHCKKLPVSSGQFTVEILKKAKLLLNEQVDPNYYHWFFNIEPQVRLTETEEKYLSTLEEKLFFPILSQIERLQIKEKSSSNTDDKIFQLQSGFKSLTSIIKNKFDSGRVDIAELHGELITQTNTLAHDEYIGKHRNKVKVVFKSIALGIGATLTLGAALFFKKYRSHLRGETHTKRELKTSVDSLKKHLKFKK